MSTALCPCRYCVAPKRYPGCHASCPEYKDWDIAHKAKLAKIREARHTEFVVCPVSWRKPKKRRKYYGNNSAE